MTFIEYLQHKKYSPATVDGYSEYIGRFLAWLNATYDAAAFSNQLLSIHATGK